MDESDLHSHESLVNSLQSGDFPSVRQILNSSTFLPYKDEHNATTRTTEQQQVIDSADTPSTSRIGDERRKHESIIESIQILLALILSFPADPTMRRMQVTVPALLVPLDLIDKFFEKIDLQYCVPTLRDSYSEHTVYYTCFIHELCIERKYDVLRVLFNKLPLDVIRRELQRHDYVPIESMSSRAAEDDVHPQNIGNQQGEDGSSLLLPEERLCTPLQGAWEKILIDDPQLILDGLDSITSTTSLSELSLGDANNQNIKDLIETSILLLSAYDGGHRSYPGGVLSSDTSTTTTTAGSTSKPTSTEGETSTSTTSRFVDRITHVLILLGHCTHTALFRLIVRLYPQSLDTRNDDGNLPIHLLSSQTIFNVTRKEASATITSTAGDDSTTNNSNGEKQSECHHVEKYEETDTRDDAFLLIDYNHRKNCKHQHGWDVPPLLMLLESYPQYASVPDKDQNLPVHLFLLSFRDNYEKKEGLRDLFRNTFGKIGLLFLEEQQWNHDEHIFGRVTFPYQQDLYSVLRGLIQANVQSLCQVDGVHGLYPFMIAASSLSKAPLDFVLYLLCSDPTILVSITTSGRGT